MYQTPIEFKTTERKTKLTGGQPCYQGQVIYNKALSVDDTRQFFAEYMQQRTPFVNLFLDSLCSFMRDYLSKGYHLDFGGFTAGLRMRGGFPAANSPFDSERNKISVELTPGQHLKEATKALKPQNATFASCNRIFYSRQISPFDAFDMIARDGERLVEVAGTATKVDVTAADEGIWIENDAGEKILQGVIQSYSIPVAHVKFTDPVVPGLHWITVSSRSEKGAPLLRTTRRITVA